MAVEILIPSPSVLYEDDDIAVVLKPAGVVVNNAATVKSPTIQSWWSARLATSPNANQAWQSLVPADFPNEYGTPEAVFAERGGVAHRLDRETSGALVLAKNPGALADLLRQFRVREVQKQYLCLVHGKFQINEGTLQLPVERAGHDRVKFAVGGEGRAAETRYRVEQTFAAVDGKALTTFLQAQTVEQGTDQKLLGIPKNYRKNIERSYQGFSLVSCWPKTGRTHQIRVHFSHIHHPLVADHTYLGKKRQVLDHLWCPRLFLHAAKIEFRHPRSQQSLMVEAPLPDDLQRALTFLQTA